MSHESKLDQFDISEQYNRALVPEYRLLLAGCRPNISANNLATMQSILEQGIDWQLLAVLLEKHALLPCFFIHLKRIGKDTVPKEHFNSLEKAYFKVVDSQSRKLDELLRLNRLFEENDIPVVPFKGPILSEMYYGDVFLRESADVDIFVPPNKAMKAQKILLSEGYTYGRDEMHLVKDPGFLASEYSLNFINQFPFEKEIGLDLHWQLFDDGFVKMPAEMVINAAQKRELFGQQLRVLPADWMLLIVSAHSAKHGWFRLNWIVDAAQLLDYIGDDVNQLVRLARETETYEMLLLACSMVHLLPEAKIPKTLMSEVAGRANIKDATSKLLTQIFGTAGAERWKLFDWWTFFLSLKETSWQKVRLAFNLSTHIDLYDWSRWQLPPPLFCLYKPLHFTRLVFISLPHLARRVRRWCLKVN